MFRNEKNNLDLQTDERYEFRKNELIIHNVNDQDEGLYRCVAWNNFSTVVDGPSYRFTAKLDHQLRVSGNFYEFVIL